MLIESASCLIDTVILLKSVLWISDIVVRIRGSVPLCLIDLDPDPDIFVIDLQEANKLL